jgi:hypothetical protein
LDRPYNNLFVLNSRSDHKAQYFSNDPPPNDDEKISWESNAPWRNDGGREASDCIHEWESEFFSFILGLIGWNRGKIIFIPFIFQKRVIM